MEARRAPVLAVGAVAVADGRLLLVRRGHGPGAGTWSVPGGRVRLGEALAQAVVRELAEETGLECVVRRFLGFLERIDLEAPESSHHFVILDFLVEVVGTGREPVAGDDATEAAWWSLDGLSDMHLAPGLLEFLEGVELGGY